MDRIEKLQKAEAITRKAREDAKKSQQAELKILRVEDISRFATDPDAWKNRKQILDVEKQIYDIGVLRQNLDAKHKTALTALGILQNQ